MIELQKTLHGNTEQDLAHKIRKTLIFLKKISQVVRIIQHSA